MADLWDLLFDREKASGEKFNASAFFYTDDEGNVRFMGGPSQGGGGVTSQSGLPEPNATGKTVRTIAGTKFVLEDLVNNALIKANSTPDEKLRTRTAKKIVEKAIIEQAQIKENERANAARQRLFAGDRSPETRSETVVKTITAKDVIVSPKDVLRTARQIEWMLNMPALDVNNQFSRFDFTSAQSLVDSYSRFLDRRIGAIRSNWSNRNR